MVGGKGEPATRWGGENKLKQWMRMKNNKRFYYERKHYVEYGLVAGNWTFNLMLSSCKIVSLNLIEADYCVR